MDVDSHGVHHGGDGLGIELTEVPRSRAPSYSSRHSVFGADDDEEPLIGDRKVKSSSTTVPRLDDGLNDSKSHHGISTVSKGKKRRLQGWRFGVAVSALLAFLVLIANLLFVIIASAKYAVSGGIGTLFDGDCHYVEGATIWLHVAINILSTLLLSASNYTMQALCSPTRAEVDRAHAAGDWLDIGMPSLRNVRGRISRRRTAAWWILLLSSVPIHLLYNSVIFKTIDSNSYRPMTVSSHFLDPGFSDDSSTAEGIRHVQKWFIENNNSARVQKLSNRDCISTYGSNFVSGYSDVLLVTADLGVREDQTVFWAPPSHGLEDSVDYKWICMDVPGFLDHTCDIPKAKRNADQWTIREKKIEYCLARITPSHCKLQFSQATTIAVIFMNIAKFVVMLWTCYFQKSLTLVTVGDAVASFLCSPDLLTTGRCLMTKSDVENGPLEWRERGITEDHADFPSPNRTCATLLGTWLAPLAAFGPRSRLPERSVSRPSTQPLIQAYHGDARRRWFAAASAKRWGTTVILLTTALIGVAVLLDMATHSYLLDSRAEAFQLGFGTIDPRLMIPTALPARGASGLLASVLLANTPQAICSFLYLAYSGLFTCMLLSDEYSRYFLRPKALRVTTPRGQQRSKYYLQLPFAYSIPLVATSALLHWLISESIFLARIDYYESGVQNVALTVSQTGYSPVPILLVILVGGIMLAVLLGHGFRKFSSPMPVVGSCSVAIASACHRPKDDGDAAYLPVAWGDVTHHSSEGVGHCTFTSQQVYEPVVGRMYAGNDVLNRDLRTLRERNFRSWTENEQY